MKTMEKHKKLRLSSAIAASALFAASGAAMAAPASLTLQYSCQFPMVGTHTITAVITADMPEVARVGEPIGDITIHADTSVPDDATVGLMMVSATTIEGTATSFTQIALNNRTIPVEVDLNVPSSPVTMGLTLPATGIQPSLTFEEGDQGPATVEVGDLRLHMISRKANGELATPPIGDFTTDCTQVPGQDNVLHRFTVEDAGNGGGDNGGGDNGGGDNGGGEPQPEIPAISVDQETVNFGDVLAGLSAQRTITISNAGTASLAVNSVNIVGGNGAFEQSNNCASVAAGSSCSVNVTYYASGEGSQSATLVIESNDELNPTVEIPLSGNSITEALPNISVSQTSINFGEVWVGQSQQQNLTISNTGTAALTINGVELASGLNAGFMIGSHNCTTVAAGSSCSIPVTFTPNGAGAAQGSVVISSNDPDTQSITVSLSGEGKEEVVVEPTIIDIAMDVLGLTWIRAGNYEIDLVGRIDSKLNISEGTFTADLSLEPAKAKFQVSKLLKSLTGDADVRFEQVGETTGTLIDGKLTAQSTVHIYVPRANIKILGLPLPVGGGKNCRTSEPVVINLATPHGEQFGPFTGGNIVGLYDLPPLQNCGLLTSTLNEFMSGPKNEIGLNLKAILDF